ncbi:DUF1800 domain-containing protein [Sandarakinorhabdus limnophila]|uniref:DUF1800 domain-containing protein n=1 Tax=Sandarakinorhabdus limnophila TaxID=210512 RepID=UPI0026EC0BAB|nr:DUF1800 domain-containing protein [Sandarakinorhabdus limnophila]MCM0032537.1 DUF1800 domain-containing protein [Sandarakinorhabdus limnophila]
MSLAAIALNRFGLGARPGDAAPADPRGWLLGQISRFDPRPAVITALPDAAAMTLQYRQNLAQLRRQGVVGIRRPGDPEPPKGPEAEAMANTAQRERRQAFAQAYGGQVNARLALSLTTATPFAERLVHFWANHFAISTDKLATATMGGPFEFEAIRQHIGGRFADMLLAVTRHPGMQFYLDQAQSIGPNSLLGEAARRRNAPRQPGLNENLAREILELHTLGAGNYTQADVAGLARALTGWSIGGFVRRPLGVAAPDGQFVFQPNWHEPGSVTVAGRPYRQNGEAQALAILNDLALNPLTARRLALKLARHFVADAPPPALVDRMAAAYLAGGGQLPALYRALIEAPEAWATPLAKFKTPWDWLVSSLRALGRENVPPLQAIGALRELGQPVWRPGSPAGWKDDAARWAAPDALLRRVEVASRIAAPLAASIDARSLAPRILPGTLSPATASAIARAESPAEGLALLLVAPEFLRR